MVLFAALALALAQPVQSAQVRPYVGRPVADVLQELQAPELRIIFSTDLVPSAMRVQAEPTSRDPKEIARQILEPHRLGLQPGPRGTLLVVVLPRVNSQPSRQRKPPATPAQPPQPLQSPRSGPCRGRWEPPGARRRPLESARVAGARPEPSFAAAR